MHLNLDKTPCSILTGADKTDIMKDIKPRFESLKLVFDLRQSINQYISKY